MSLRSFQWPFLWSFYVPLPCPLCALVNVRRTRRMDGCVNPVGDVRDDNSCGHVSRMYETYRLWIMCNLAVKKKRITCSLSRFGFSSGDEWPPSRLNKPISRWRERNKERGDQRQLLLCWKKKKAVTQSKQHCTTSSSALYQCIHGNGLFYHPKKKRKLPLSAQIRLWGQRMGGLLGRRSPTCKWCECQPAGFLFFSWWERTLLSLPTCSPNIPCWCDDVVF